VFSCFWVLFWFCVFVCFIGFWECFSVLCGRVLGFWVLGGVWDLWFETCAKKSDFKCVFYFVVVCFCVFCFACFKSFWGVLRFCVFGSAVAFVVCGAYGFKCGAPLGRKPCRAKSGSISCLQTGTKTRVCWSFFDLGAAGLLGLFWSRGWSLCLVCWGCWSAGAVGLLGLLVSGAVGLWGCWSARFWSLFLASFLG
jgi:hypothetical protein